VQIRCAVNCLLQLNADSMCSEITGFTLDAVSMCRFDVQIQSADSMFCTAARTHIQNAHIKNVCRSACRSAMACSVVSREFHRTSNLHSNAADVLLHIPYAHQQRKSNRLFSACSSHPVISDKSETIMMRYVGMQK
jgi:hypothetical protein